MNKYYYYLVPIKLFAERIVSYDVFEDIWSGLMANAHSAYEDSSEEEKNIIDNVNDRIGFVAENPPKEDRKDGYINAEEFRQWLKDNKIV